MSNELEKLKILVESSCLHFAEDLAKPIETALKRLEELDSIYTLTNHNGKFYVVIDKTEFDQISKKLEALEIIKRYVQLEDDKVYTIGWEWNLTQEEYDLLKETLCK